jgi:hypothetical protein
MMPGDIRCDTSLYDFLCDGLHAFTVGRIVAIVHREIKAVRAVDLSVD